jgi:hypothetical protein
MGQLRAFESQGPGNGQPESFFVIAANPAPVYLAVAACVDADLPGQSCRIMVVATDKIDIPQ